jgi:hypothetical protein
MAVAVLAVVVVTIADGGAEGSTGRGDPSTTHRAGGLVEVPVGHGRRRVDIRFG